MLSAQPRPHGCVRAACGIAGQAVHGVEGLRTNVAAWMLCQQTGSAAAGSQQTGAHPVLNHPTHHPTTKS
eukprot:scaffold6100_cov129-Isochrysis_galbana.AAC.3